MEGADLAICSAGRTVDERAPHARAGHCPGHARKGSAAHLCAGPQRLCALQASWTKYRFPHPAIFFSPCSGRKGRARYWEAQDRLILAATKARVVGLIENLLEKGLIKMGQDKVVAIVQSRLGSDQAAVQGFSGTSMQAAD